MEYIAFVVIAIIAFVIKLINAASDKRKQSARLNKVQQGLTAPPRNQSDKQPAQPVPSDQVGQYQVPGQVTSLFQALRSKGQFPPPGQYQQPAPFQQNPVTWLPAYQPPPPPPHVGRGLKQHRPPQNNLPAPKGDVDTRVRELMAAHNEVGAVRLLCDDRDMGIIEAQEYARSLVRPPGQRPSRRTEEATTQGAGSAAIEEETRYVGSAAFAESVFSTSADENVWASGWVDKPEAEDRSDMDELWQTVRDAGKPRPS
jgi:hypothetical protein